MQTKIVITKLSELPQAPTTIGTMAWNQTGDWRYVTPLVADKAAPCSQNCPAGIPIPRHLGELTRGDAEGALTRLVVYNPLPGLTGRLCYHPCQTKCVRRKIDKSVSIQEVEKFLGDSAAGTAMAGGGAKKEGRVAIIGSGPLGLACAFFLGCQGYGVTVLDPAGQPGGALLALLPEKLEPRVLSREIDRLLRLADIRLETGAVVDFARLGELAPKAELVILDPTGLAADFCPPGDAAACDPFGEDALTGPIVSLQLPKNLAPFRAPMIAHYIAAGRLLAAKAAACLRREGDAEPAPEPQLQAVNAENIKIGRFGAGLAEEEEPGAEEARDAAWAVKEAGRCLSCGTCNLCLQCVSYCPDASILPARGRATVAVDMDHCKGCGICAYECPRGVITMEDMSV